MKKFIINFVILMILMAFGVSAYFYFSSPQSYSPEPPDQTGRCGDNTCDEFEKANPNACPEDCPFAQSGQSFQTSSKASPFPFPMSSSSSKKTTSSKTSYSSSASLPQLPPPSSSISSKQSSSRPAVLSSSFDSPFGFHENLGREDYFTDIGAKWIRLSGPVGLVWTADEPERGKFNWERMDNVVNYYGKIADNILVTVNSFNEWDQQMIGANKHKIPNDLSGYANYLKTAAKRYPQIKYWQIENEPANEWADTPENMAKLVKTSAAAIREINPQAKILLAGAAVPGEFEYFYRPLLAELQKLERQDGVKYLDAVDLHWSGQFENKDKSQATYLKVTISNKDYDYKTEIKTIRKILDDLGYKNDQIWVTEMSDYSGKPSDSAYLEQSEKEQANEVFKRYAYSLAVGVKKIFWASLMEFHNYGNVGVNNYWDNVGLVNNPQNDGESHKKLGYYTYKKMVEVLEGSDWNNIQTIQEQGGVYVYKFMKGGKPIWVAWNDNGAEKQITISGVNSSSVKITEAVPNYSSGKEVTSYNTAFKTETVGVENGKATIKIKDVPVFVEEDY